jgi:acyl-CoA reductase-like NAD-dependent aldehyde dehydrogenase
MRHYYTAEQIRAAEAPLLAGLPDGVLQVVNGTAPVVQALCAHPGIAGCTFVGSSKVGEIVYKACHAVSGKRVLALGGAKNHMVALPDCNRTMCAADVAASFTGCAGQRCMAATVLLIVGEQPELIDAIVAKAAALQPGQGAGVAFGADIGFQSDFFPSRRSYSVYGQATWHVSYALRVTGGVER